MFVCFASARNTPTPGVRTVEPSIKLELPVPITAPIVGVPITLPSPNARKPAGNISAFEAERQVCNTTFGPKKPANGRLVASVPRGPATPHTAAARLRQQVCLSHVGPA